MCNKGSLSRPRSAGCLAWHQQITINLRRFEAHRLRGGRGGMLCAAGLAQLLQSCWASRERTSRAIPGQTVMSTERHSPELGSGGRAVDATERSTARLLTRDHADVASGARVSTDKSVLVIGHSAAVQQIVQRARRVLGAEPRVSVSYAQRQVRAIVRSAMVSYSRAAVQCAGCTSCAMHELCKASCVTVRSSVAQNVGPRRTLVAAPALGIRQPKSRQISMSSSFQARRGR